MNNTFADLKEWMTEQFTTFWQYANGLVYSITDVQLREGSFTGTYEQTESYLANDLFNIFIINSDKNGSFCIEEKLSLV